MLTECVWGHEIILHKNDIYYSWRYPRHTRYPVTDSCRSKRWYLGVSRTGNKLRHYQSTVDTCSRVPGSSSTMTSIHPTIKRRTLFIQRWVSRPNWPPNQPSGPATHVAVTTSYALPEVNQPPETRTGRKHSVTIAESFDSRKSVSAKVNAVKRHRSRLNSHNIRCRQRHQQQQQQHLREQQSSPDDVKRRKPCKSDHRSVNQQRRRRDH